MERIPNSSPHSPLSALDLRLLAAAPHRLLFFAGATNVLLAMTWWALWLIDARWHLIDLPQPVVPAGWLHAIVMQYQVLPAFMFGFLLTVFPRWMSLPALRKAHYLPLGLSLFAGQAFTLAGMLGGLWLLKLGALLVAIAWVMGTTFLGRLVYIDKGRTLHAVSCMGALGFGLLGQLLYIVFLHSADPRLLFASIKIGSIAVLLPIYFTVCHRMIPFFAGAVLPHYRVSRPLWSLGMLWALWILHTWLELRHGYAWLWLPDLAVMTLTAWLLWLWWPRDSKMPALLRVLFLGFAWLPIAFALYAGQSLWYAATGEFVLGRAPAHALFVGFFGSLLVAMVTRVTQGHSGRPLVLGRTAAFAFIALQAVALMRVLAELVPDSLTWQAIAASGWIVAFLPWVVRSGRIYLSPRIDGQPG